jgi:hypothetical protein
MIVTDLSGKTVKCPGSEVRGTERWGVLLGDLTQEFLK